MLCRIDSDGTQRSTLKSVPLCFGGRKKTVDEQTNPTGGELELLSVLWEHGALSLSEFHDRIGRDLGYTTVQTRLNRLVEKGWAEKTKIGKQPTHYAALVQPDAVRERQLDHFVERVAQGSVVPLVAHLVQGNSLTRDELTELKKLIRDAERRHEASASDTKSSDRSRSGNKAGGH
ncbi:MAG: BlaI/MecI/CopY family transcriptional regulator [Planctomycetota bacterium]|nr:MAG: BlaI/MecI/CopY family transcriptional regulator [Planctomycetota bacterium]